MQKVVIYTQREWEALPLAIVKAIQEEAAKNWGVKFVDRETGKESEEMAIYGLFVDAVRRVLEGN